MAPVESEVTLYIVIHTFMKCTTNTISTQYMLKNSGLTYRAHLKKLSIYLNLNKVEEKIRKKNHKTEE